MQDPDSRWNAAARYLLDSLTGVTVERAIQVGRGELCIGLPDFDTMSKKDWLRWQEQRSRKEKATDCKIHHVATNKHDTEFTPKLNAELAKVGLTLDDAANLCRVCNVGDGRRHDSRHSTEYHQAVLDGVKAIVSHADLTPQQKKQAVRAFLWDICRRLNTPGDWWRMQVTNSR